MTTTNSTDHESNAFQEISVDFFFGGISKAGETISKAAESTLLEAFKTAAKLEDLAARLVIPIQLLKVTGAKVISAHGYDAYKITVAVRSRDQCRLFMQGKMPFAFLTWALVSDEVHHRLSLGQSRLAPHEWHSGGHAWLIDVVAPFGGQARLVDELLAHHFSSYVEVNYLEFDPGLQIFQAKAHQPGKNR